MACAAALMAAAGALRLPIFCAETERKAPTQAGATEHARAAMALRVCLALVH